MVKKFEQEVSNLYLSDLTQAVFTPGSPGTWSAPTALVKIREWNPYDGSESESGLDGVAVACTSHGGIVIAEYPFPPSSANAFMVIQLPSTSGSGTRSLVDYVVGTLPNDPDGNSFSLGCDPHTVAAYVSPNTGKALGVITDYGATGLLCGQHCAVPRIARPRRHPGRAALGCPHHR